MSLSQNEKEKKGVQQELCLNSQKKPHPWEYLPTNSEAPKTSNPAMAQLGPWSSRKSVPGIRNGSSAEEILDNTQGLDGAQGWNEDKIHLGAQAEDTQCVHSAQGKG